jgi:hypothetical protein
MLVVVFLAVTAVVGIVLIVRFFLQPSDSRPFALMRARLPGARVTPMPADGHERDTYVVIPDISGYTRFMRLNRFAGGHAQFVVTELLDAILTAAVPPLSATRIEGDSIMFYATSIDADPGSGVDGETVAGAVHDLVSAFYLKRAVLATGNLCPCAACRDIADLDIKVVVHRGDVVHYYLHGLEDLGGFVVIEAHRLLKNSLERSHYVLVSEAAARSVTLSWRREPEAHCESYDDIGDVSCDLYLLEDGSVGDIVAVPRMRDLTGKLAANARDLVGLGR